MVGLRVECDVAGCGRHFVVDTVMDAYELVDLSANTPRSVALELFVELPEGWRCEGNALAVVPERRFRVWCREHGKARAREVRAAGGAWELRRGG